MTLVRWPRGTRSPQPLHLRSKGGFELVSISYGMAIMRRFQLDWNGSFEIGSAATEGRFLLIMEAFKCIICGTRHRPRQPCPAMADVIAEEQKQQRRVTLHKRISACNVTTAPGWPLCAHRRAQVP